MKNLFNKYLNLSNIYRQYVAYDKARYIKEAEEVDSVKSEIYENLLRDLQKEFGIVLGHQTIEAVLPADHITFEYEEFFVTDWGRLE